MGLKTLWLKIKGDSKGLESSLKKSEGAVNKFGKTIKKLGGMIAGAFAIREIIRFGKEVVQLAAKVEGIRKAFTQLNDEKLLANLRAATHGTVSDLDLMQKAVQARNFEIPVKNLAQLFEFAAARAVQTGESVDYLVNSIVIGIGRKSPLILDNLGISAVTLREKLDHLGHSAATVGQVAEAVGLIAEKELDRMGGFVDTTATKIARLTAKWENLKARVGTVLIESGIVDTLVDAAEAIVKGALGLINPKAALMLEEAAYLQKELVASKEREKQLYEDIDEIAFEMEGLRKIEIGQRLKLSKLANDMTRQAQKEKEYQEDIVEALKEKNRIARDNAPRKPKIDYHADWMFMLRTDQERGIEKQISGIFDPSKVDLHQSGEYAAITWTDGFQQTLYEQFERMELSAILRDMTQEAAQVIADTIGMAFEAIGSGNFENLGNDLLKNFANFLSMFGKLLVAYGISLLTFFEAFGAGPVGAIAAIGAGIAAIAIAGLIRGAASDAGNALQGGGGYGGSYGSASGGQSVSPQSIQVEGVLKGSDIVISSRRYTNKRSSVT
jgi:hypothetical protein